MAAEIRGPHPGRRVPDFFIVGHARSGSSALYQMLRSHSQVFMPERKEPRFFASDLPTRYKPGHPNKLGETYDDYLALFDGAKPEQRVGEASPTYIWSQTAPELISIAQPSARIIAILREPASFVRSLHIKLVQRGVETEKSLRKALALEESRRQGRELGGRVLARFPQALIYTDRVRYAAQVRRLRELFSQERVLVLIYDDYKRDNEGTVRKVQRFLDVDDAVPIAFSEINHTVRVRSERLHTLSRRVASGQSPTARAARAAARTLAPRGVIRESAVAIGDRLLFAPPRAPDEGVMLALRRRFKPEVVALSEYLERDLVSLWGYEQLD